MHDHENKEGAITLEKEETRKWVKPLRELSRYEFVMSVDDYNLLSTIFIGMNVSPKSFTRVYVPWFDVCNAGFAPTNLKYCAKSSEMRAGLCRLMEGK